MKNLLILLLIVFTFSCNNDNVEYSCTKGTIRILNKKSYPCARGGGDCYFNFYLYDGKEAYWCSTNGSTFNSYQINDTLPTLVITKIIHEKVK